MLSSVQSWLEGAAAADPKGLVLQAEAATRDPGYKLRRQQMIGSCQIAGRGRDALGDTSFLPRTRERRTICVSGACQAALSRRPEASDVEVCLPLWRR